ncbi:hypothetical protein AGMMS49936_03780 [Endomicrobiia bacterium]|nr:hypothetical protein AGMMS49936_03780 [Endomicrobiia bacterium]
MSKGSKVILKQTVNKDGYIVLYTLAKGETTAATGNNIMFCKAYLSTH